MVCCHCIRHVFHSNVLFIYTATYDAKEAVVFTCHRVARWVKALASQALICPSSLPLRFSGTHVKVKLQEPPLPSLRDTSTFIGRAERRWSALRGSRLSSQAKHNHMTRAQGDAGDSLVCLSCMQSEEKGAGRGPIATI